MPLSCFYLQFVLIHAEIQGGIVIFGAQALAKEVMPHGEIEVTIKTVYLLMSGLGKLAGRMQGILITTTYS